MSIKIKTINNVKVRPSNYIVGGDNDNRPVLGSALFQKNYCNIFIESKKNSGKTVVLNNIVRNCCNSFTKVLVFSSTVDIDKEHLSIKHYCKQKNIPYTGYTSMFDDNGSNIIDELVSNLQHEAKDDIEDNIKKDEKKPLLIFNLDSDSDDDEVKLRKSKYKSPKYFIILDDLSHELKTKSLIYLFKMHRHFGMKIAVSSQYCNDLDPQSRKQMDYCLVFKGEREDKLKQLHRDFDLSIDFELFREIYINTTEQKYNFLYIDIRDGKFRKNFNKEYDLSDFEN